MSAERFLIFDGHGLMWRALHRPGAPLTSPRTKEPTRGTYTFTQMLISILREFKPTYSVFAGDAPRSSTFRKQLFDGYKSNRPTDGPDDAMFVQMGRCRQVVEEMGMRWYVADEFEADDVIATLVDICAGDDVEIVIVSSDHDLNQLCTGNVIQYDPGKELRMNEDFVRERWEVEPDQIEEVMVLSGDSGDGVPGVPGIGTKTATKLIQQYGSVQGVLDNLGDLSEKKVLAFEGTDLTLARQLVSLRRDVPLDIQVSDLEFDGVDHNRLAPLFLELGFQSLL